jgi:hypothetical protein
MGASIFFIAAMIRTFRHGSLQWKNIFSFPVVVNNSIKVGRSVFCYKYLQSRRTLWNALYIKLYKCTVVTLLRQAPRRAGTLENGAAASWNSYPLHSNEIAGQFHAAVTLYSEKELPALSNRRLRARHPVWTKSKRSVPSSQPERQTNWVAKALLEHSEIRCWYIQVFHTWKNVSANYSQSGHAPSKLFASPVIGRKTLKNIGLKDAKLLVCSGCPRVSGRPWERQKCLASGGNRTSTLQQPIHCHSSHLL